jgi:Protein of unknown function (DUF1573)
MFILSALLIGRPNLQPLWHEPRSFVKASLPFLWLLGGVGAISALLLGLASYSFGSLPAAIAYFRGDRISVQPDVADLGRGYAGELRQTKIEVSNWTDKTVRVIGANQDCSCTVVDLPVTIPAGETRPVGVNVRFKGKPGIFTRKGILILDDQGFKRAAFRMTGRILTKPETAVSNQSTRKGD